MTQTWFYLFAGLDHYPGGGMQDWQGRYETLDEAKEAANRGAEGEGDLWGWAQIVVVDADSHLAIVAQSSDLPGRWNR